jgi:hypothetical protein
MGNTVSEEDVADENQFFNSGLNLESPEADSQMNLGTAAPNCQPKHTALAASSSSEGQEVGLNDLDGSDAGIDRPKPLRSNSTGSNNSVNSAQDPKKMSYIQMAKVGYQELVNAIIRPPRADYKVCCVLYRGWYTFETVSHRLVILIA